MKIVSFFGSIAVGKTTLGRKISSKYSNVQFLEEELGYNPFIEKMGISQFYCNAFFNVIIL